MSGARRFFAPDVTAGEYALEGEEYNHAANVLRLKAGDEVVVSDGAGKDYSGTVERVEKKRMVLRLAPGTENPCKPKTGITLAVGFLKGDKTELVVQKATELGASRVVVFDSEFSSAFVSENKLGRLTRVAEEAAKQCGRAEFPAVEYLPLKEALNAFSGVKNKIFACEFEEETPLDLSGLLGETVLFVGSEGGFSQKERELALSLGYRSVTLGRRILRAETAAISLLAVAAYRLGEWDR